MALGWVFGSQTVLMNFQVSEANAPKVSTIVSLVSSLTHAPLSRGWRSLAAAGWLSGWRPLRPAGGHRSGSQDAQTCLSSPLLLLASRWPGRCKPRGDCGGRKTWRGDCTVAGRDAGAAGAV